MNILIVCKLLYVFIIYMTAVYGYMLYYVRYMNLIIIKKW